MMKPEHDRPFPFGGGEMGERVRQKDWSGTSLGPIERWEPALRMAAGLTLEAGLPCILYWGKELIGIHNDAYQPLLGSKPEALGRSPFEIWPEAAEVIRPMIEKALLGESCEFASMPFSLLRHGYPERAWFTWSCSPVRDNCGEVRGVVIFALETTAQAAEERRHSFLLKLSDVLRDATEPKEIAHAAARMLGEEVEADRTGYAELEPDGQGYRIEEEWHSPRVPSLARTHLVGDFGRKLFETLQAGEVMRIDDVAAYLRRTGEGKPSGFAAGSIQAAVNVPVIADRCLSAILFVNHATPRRWTDVEVSLIEETALRTCSAMKALRASLALARSEERFRLLADSMPQLVWTARSDGVVDYMNSRFREFAGIHEAAAGSWEWKASIHPEDEAATLAAWTQAVASGQSYQVEHRVRSADGSYRWHLSRATPVTESGRVAKWFGTATDIHDRKQAEAAIRQSEQAFRRLSETLEHRVGERTAELQEQTRRLRHLAAELATAEHRERKRLAALLHDDLQQLLVAANMQMNSLRSSVTEGGSKAAVERAARWIGEAVQAARDLTLQLRPPSLYESGLISALQWLAGIMRERHGLAVTVSQTGSRPPLDDDEKALLFDCVRELLFNVAKYAAVDRAEVRVINENDLLRVVVADQGRGFDASSAENARPAGGYGLFSIRERLMALGGGTKIESSPGMGTTIELRVPLVQPSGTEGGAGPPKGAVALVEAVKTADEQDARKRVLVVDDHAMVREGIASALRADPRLRVVGEAADGLEAIEAVDATSPDVVLIDLNMPRMNGIEATREIRRLHPEVVVIGLSVQDDEATARSMREAGAAAFLSKSGDTGQMVATIFSLVGEAVVQSRN
jgi:PAS domain S-box-containing protein